MSQDSQEWHQGGTLESTQRALRDHLESTQRAVLILADLWEGKLNWNNWPSTSWKTWQLASLNIGKVDTDEWQGPFGWPRFYIDSTYSSTWDCASRCKAHTCPKWHGGDSDDDRFCIFEDWRGRHWQHWRVPFGWPCLHIACAHSSTWGSASRCIAHNVKVPKVTRGVGWGSDYYL